MKYIHGRIIFSALLLLFMQKGYGQGYQNNALIEAYKNYKMSSYNKALDALKKARGSKNVLGTRYYLEGIILNRLQRYDEAIKSFENAIKMGNTSSDLYYEFGQALYANSDLLKARIAFKKSADQNYKKDSSLYYVAHISQLLEEHKLARDTYIKLIKTAKDDKRLQQVSRFQLSESFLAMAENRDDTARLVEKYVIPSLKKAYNILPKAPLAKDIQKRQTEIERQYGLDPNLMRNGRVLPEDRFSARFRHEFRYDSNITLATDIPTAQILQKDTFIHETNFNMNYLMSFSGRHTMTPFMRIRNTYHTDRESETVFQNDTYNITTGLRNTYEHKLFNQQANLLYEYNYIYIGRDYNKQKERPFFSRAHQFSLGERFRFFNFGPTTFKFKYKDYEAYDLGLNNRTISFSGDQIRSTPAGNLFIFFFQADFINNYNNPTISTNNFLFRTDYLIPEIFPTYTLNLAMSLSFLDTKLQQATRGTEKNYSPSIELRKRINRTLSTSLGYSYTRNVSQNKQNFDYKKHNISFEISASY